MRKEKDPKKRKNGLAPAVTGDDKLSKYVKSRTADINPIDFTQPIQYPDSDQYKWMAEYMKSPNYINRLNTLTPNPDKINRIRLQAVMGNTLDDVSSGGVETSGANRLEDRAISINNGQLRRNGLRRDETVLHELAHTFNSNPWDPSLRMPLEEEKYMWGKERMMGKYDTEHNQHIIKYAEKNKIPLSRAITDQYKSHDQAPDELKGDIMSLKYLLDRSGLYDPKTQQINKEILEKAKSDWRINNSHNFKRLQRAFYDDDLIEIMNTVTKNNKSPLSDERVRRQAAFYGPWENNA